MASFENRPVDTEKSTGGDKGPPEKGRARGGESLRLPGLFGCCAVVVTANDCNAMKVDCSCDVQTVSGVPSPVASDINILT
jgi:hypothetical protein